MILSVKILEWKKLIRKSELLILLFLTKLNLNLYINSDIWLKSARDLCLSVIQQQQIDINRIQISKTYQETMKSSQRNEWITAMKIEIHDINKKKIYSLVKQSDKKIKIRIFSRKWVYLIKVNKNDEILKYKVC